MKFILINPDINFIGGNERLIISFSQEAIKNGHNVEIICPYISELFKEELIKLNISIFSINKKSPRMSVLVISMIFTTLIYMVFNYKRNCNDRYIFLNFPANLTAFLFRKSICFWYRNEDTAIQLKLNYQNGLKLYLAKFFIIIETFVVNHFINKIFVSDFSNKKLCSNYKNPTIVIPYGLKFDIKKKNSNFSKKNKSYLQVGVYSEEKGQLNTLHALSRVLGEKNFQLALYGNINVDNNYFERVKFEVGSLSNITIYNEVSHSEILKLMLNNMYFIHPVKFQGGWLAALEAVRCGCLLICTNDAPFSKYFSKLKLANVYDDLDHSIINNLDYDPILALARSKKVSNLFTWDRFFKKIHRVVQ